MLVHELETVPIVERKVLAMTCSIKYFKDFHLIIQVQWFKVRPSTFQ